MAGATPTVNAKMREKCSELTNPQAVAICEIGSAVVRSSIFAFSAR